MTLGQSFVLNALIRPDFFFVEMYYMQYYINYYFFEFFYVTWCTIIVCSYAQLLMTEMKKSSELCKWAFQVSVLQLKT